MSLMRTYRRALGLSQSAFAARLNVPLETYRPWDAGRREPPPQLLTRARTLAGYPDDTVLLPLPVLALMIGVHVRTLHAAARSGRLGVAYDTRTTFRRLRPRATLKHALDFRRHYYGTQRRPPATPVPLTWASVPEDYDVQLKALDRKALMPMWRYAVITLLREAARAGVLDTDMSRSELLRLLTAQYERWWNIDVKRFKSKKQFLGYAGRYARRPPIAQHRFRTITRQEVRFVTRDTRTKRTVETTYTPAEFLATLADHVPDRYRHNVRYFGLLAPRVKCQTHDAVFALLGQERLGKPGRLRWATSMQKCFGVDPLVDRDGRRMRWARRVPPAQPVLAVN